MDSSDPFKREREEWRRLTKELNAQARAIADRLMAQGPDAIQRLGPQVERYAATRGELDALLRRVAAPVEPHRGPDWG